MIKFSNVYKRYPGEMDALQDISLEISSGELIFVTGPSGAGKSTLLKLISAVEKPTSGTIIFENQNLNYLQKNEMPFLRRKFGMIFQDHKLLFDRTCYDNVALPLAINEIDPSDIGRRVRAALNKVGLLTKERVMPMSLSGGEQQRLAIARAIVSRPSILIADEPTANLDRGYADEIMNIFYSFQQVGVTVIISSHEIPKTTIHYKEFHLITGNLQNVPLLT
ncbi:MAG: ATP-binding cassette domain-containing protein [Proteobacteria bacterium]|nr:ATP-binding cassette domain-containing protein [Pseudomonadota bacterium]MDA0873234.1 ATP-binding cassette domain-containing protein [Pseudomonadota bacterium]MDA1133951.1 ATP-binding cassette domain-containing protein [Pseudomonadota bacterium]